MFGDPQVREAVRVTAIFVLVAVPLELALGFLLALLFNRHIFGRPVLRAVMILPIFATPLAVGYTFFTIFYEVGGPLGWTRIPFLSNPDWALFSVILVDVWQWTPFCFLVFLAALQGVPDELYEAARMDGAGPLDMLFQVLLPVLQADDRPRAAPAHGRGAKALRHSLRDDGRRARRRDAALLDARLPHRLALLRSRLCERHGLRAARRRR